MFNMRKKTKIGKEKKEWFKTIAYNKKFYTQHRQMKKKLTREKLFRGEDNIF